MRGNPLGWVLVTTTVGIVFTVTGTLVVHDDPTGALWLFVLAAINFGVAYMSWQKR